MLSAAEGHCDGSDAAGQHRAYGGGGGQVIIDIMPAGQFDIVAGQKGSLIMLPPDQLAINSQTAGLNALIAL